MNRKNLLVLANYLLDFKPNGIRFDMLKFTNASMELANSLTDCDTCGCAIGHGPYAGIEKLDSEDWFRYSSRCFIDSFSSEWNWCFAWQ